MSGRRTFENHPIPVKLKLSALWASVMFCYVYGDFFGLFIAGKVAKMNAGMIPPLGEATPTVLLGVSVMMAIPSLMVALSLLLPPSASRWSNIVIGGAYSVIVLLTMIEAPLYYLFFGSLDVVLTLAIVWVAVRWPRQA